MGTQTEIATQIVGKGADYILSLKANHPTLLAEVKAWFDAAQAIGLKGLNTAMTNRSRPSSPGNATSLGGLH